MSLGRNQPCHCGSGKKYKHCHLDSDQELASKRRLVQAHGLVDVITSKLAELALADPVAFDAERHREAREVRASFLKIIGSGLAGKSAADALAQQLEAIEQGMQATLSARPAELWFIVSRRLPPAPIGGCSPWTVELYRRILTLAILKHGDHQADVEFDTIELPIGVSQVPVGIDDVVLREIASLEVLAWEYAMTASAYRRVGKGASLVCVNSKATFDTPAASEFDRLIASFDKRRNPHRRRADTADHGSEDTKVPLEQAVYTIAGVALNVHAESAAQLQENIGVPLPDKPTYLPATFSLADGLDAIKPFAAAFQIAYGVSPEVAVGTVWSLGSRLMETENGALPLWIRQALTTGYQLVRPTEIDRVLGRLSAMYKAWREHAGGLMLSEADAKDELAKGVEALTYSDGDYPAISLWDRLPFKCLVPFGDRLYVDYAAVTDVLAGFHRSVGAVQGKAGNVKGKRFEDDVLRRGNAAGLQPWLARCKLVADDETTREIDCSFVVNETLWVLECKAHHQDIRIDRGDHAKLRSQREKLTKDLKQGRTLVEFLREHPKGTNYSVPDNVTEIECCVLTTGVEWIWSEDPGLWLTDDIPRICTLDELLSLLT